jgi:Fe-S-cluster containining protein
MDPPTEQRDFDFMRWFLVHDRASVFIEDENWFLLVHTVCKHLQPDNRCGIYLTRPQICREYHTDSCEYEDHYVYDGYFETSEQVQDYIEARFLNTPDSPQFRSPPPEMFPILN